MKSKLDIRRAIKEHGLTVLEFCNTAGFPYPNFSRYTNGNPTLKTLYKIADTLGCDILDLFYPIDGEIAQETPSIEQERPISEHQEPVMEHTYICPKCGTKFKIIEST